MSLTSYRASPPRDRVIRLIAFSPWGRLPLGIFEIVSRAIHVVLIRFGSDLLSHTLRCSTIGAMGLNFRVRDGIGCLPHAMTTKPEQNNKPSTKDGIHETVFQSVLVSLTFEVFRHLAITGSNQAYRAISTGQLNALLHLHLRPIDVVVFHGPQGDLVLRGASRLDAFSGYPVRS